MADASAGAEGEDPIVTRARKRFQQALEAEDENRVKEQDDMRFLAASPDDNYQWPTEIYQQRSKPGQEGGIRPCLTINKLPSHQRQVTNELRMNRPQIKVRPADSKASKEVAKALNGWLRHIQVASEADLAIDTACDWQTGGGVGYFRMYTQYADEMSREQTVVFEPCPDRFKVYMDPIGLRQHPAGRKCKWGFIVEDLPRDEYEAEYGEENPIDWSQGSTGDMLHWFPSADMVRIAEYFEIKETKKTICEWQAPDGTTAMTVKDSDEEKQWQAQGYQKTGFERPTKIPRCIWRRMNGQKVIGKEKEMPTKFLTIIRVVGNYWIIDGKLIVSGMIRNAKDAQRMYNYNASKEIEVNALAPLAPITAMVEQIKGHEDRYRTSNTVAHAYLPFNAMYNEDGTIALVQPPQRVQPPMPSMAIIQAKVGADNDIKATMGQWGPALGEPSAEKSGKAINARKNESDMGSFQYVDNVARALRYAGAIALDMGAEIIDRKQIVRILGEDGEPDHIVVDPNSPVGYREEQGQDGKVVKIYNFSFGKYEVVVDVGPSSQTRRQEAAEFLTSAVQSARDPASANTLVYLAMKNQDWAGAEQATTALEALLPQPVREALMPDDGSQPKIPPQVQQMLDQIKQVAGHTKGQLDAAQQALQERDAKLRDLEGQIKGRNVDALAKMYDADMKALSEITRARSEVLIAQAKALEIQSQQPDNPQVQAVTQALGHFAGEMDAKISALAESATQIKQQLDNFEIAGRIQQQQPDAQVMQS
jgi:hypothetical protein